MNVQVLGGILGLCVADALGVPVEFKSRRLLDSKPVMDMIGYGTYDQPAGTWSDDTSMNLCLMDSLCEGLDYGDIMEKFSKWAGEGEYTPHGETFDIGHTTRMAIRNYNHGVEPLQCGLDDINSNGNGSLMRILPAAFYLGAKEDYKFVESSTAMETIHNISKLTHAHPISQIACGIYLSIAQMMMGRMYIDTAIQIGLRDAYKYYRSKDEFKEHLEAYHRLWDPEFSSLTRGEIQSTGYVVHSLEAALWCLQNTDSYSECALVAVNLGEDTDTVASIAGGLAGISYGYESIPKSWMVKLAKKKEIEALCEKFSQSLI